MIDVRKIHASEAPKLEQFIDAYWQKGHILSRHRTLLDWQHKESDGDAYAYLGAWDGQELLAILGYIPTRRFDSDIAADNVSWLALWKLRDDIKVAGLGLRLLQTLDKLEPSAPIGVLGINPSHLPMYRALRYDTGELQQFVLFNSEGDQHLAILPEGAARPVARAGRAILRECDSATLKTFSAPLALGDRAGQLPRKSPLYFANRFLRHPIYRYRVFTVSLDGEISGLIATRLAEHDGRHALRIADWYGNPQALAEIGPALQRLLHEEKAEYVDFWQYGIDLAPLAAAGFATVATEGHMVVPTFFEPFVQENRRLLFAFRNRTQKPYVLVKADGDQDRPSRPVKAL